MPSVRPYHHGTAPGHAPSVPFPSALPGSPNSAPPSAREGRKSVAPYTETGSYPEARGNAAGQAGAPTVKSGGGWYGYSAAGKDPSGHDPPRSSRPPVPLPAKESTPRLVSSVKLLWDGCKTPQFDPLIIPQNGQIVKWKFRLMSAFGGPKRADLPAFRMFTIRTQILICDRRLFLTDHIAVTKVPVFAPFKAFIRDLSHLFTNRFHIFACFFTVRSEKVFCFGRVRTALEPSSVCFRSFWEQTASSCCTKTKGYFLHLGEMTKMLPPAIPSSRMRQFAV